MQLRIDLNEDELADHVRQLGQAHQEIEDGAFDNMDDLLAALVRVVTLAGEATEWAVKARTTLTRQGITA